MVTSRLILRLGARFAAQTLAGLGAGALLELATWRAALIGLASNIVPAIVYLLEQYANGRSIAEAAADLQADQ